MSLELLSSQIEAEAKAEASEIIKAAEEQAKLIRAEAEAEAENHMKQALSRAEKDAEQISVEVVASVRQQKQNAALVARRVLLDNTYRASREAVSTSKMKGRNALIKSLVKESKSEASKGMIMHPVEVDRSTIEKEKSGFKMGDSVEGLGGFTLESSDGDILLDYRFDGRLEAAWKKSLSEINTILFG